VKKGKQGARIELTDHRGRATRIRAEHVDIDFGDGRRLLVSIPDQGHPLIEIVAESAEGAPLLRVVQHADNAVGVGFDVVDAQLDTQHEATVAPVLQLMVQKALSGDDRSVAPKKHQIRRWASAALLSGSAEVTIRLVGETEGRTLNCGFRGKDYATNVLTFVYAEGEQAPGTRIAADAPLQGDMVLCVPVIVREAREQGKALMAHFAHLVVHGMLHLQGFDHERPEDAVAMEALEVNILAALGIGDPYRL
jgi:probable rRNA maturation factor